MRSFPSRLQLLLLVIPLITTACSGGGAVAPPGPATNDSTRGPSRSQAGPQLEKPALITIDLLTGDLLYWPIKEGPSGTPITLTGNLGTYDANALVSNGDVVIIASQTPAEIIEYNVKSKTETIVPDPFGAPSHVAVDRAGTIYALGRHQVGVFPKGSSQPYKIDCRPLEHGRGLSIAVDDEQDVFVAAGPGIFELPAGSRDDCVKPHLRRPSNLGGIGIDPKTDDFIVVDNPGYGCSYEGRITIYPKPYSVRTSSSHEFYVSYCAGGFRLDAHSKHIYISDETVDESYPLIDRFSYPFPVDGQYYADYNAYTGGFTLIPSALPN